MNPKTISHNWDRQIIKDEELLKKGERIEKSEFGYNTANPQNYLVIKEMRDNLKKNLTKEEALIWQYLRNKKIGHKIRRQHIIENFITDFVCLRKKVVIEIDGEIHLQKKVEDELRTQRLRELEYEVIRFTNKEVLANIELVIQKIKGVLDQRNDIENY